MQSIALLGRQPAIGLAELESLYGAAALSGITQDVVRVDAPLDIARLGGTVKTAEELIVIDSQQLRDILAACKRLLPTLIEKYPEGKLKVGLSFHNLERNVRTINAAGLELKKIIRGAGRSVRVVPNQTPELSSAQTLHNQLTSGLGLEFLFIRHGSRTIIARVTGVQNIESYTLRDRGRPQRDTRVGMLPPKLAQIIINLATGRLHDADTGTTDTVILDPFCGTGVVLQEAALMGYAVYGSDVEERMVRYTRDNLNWLFETYRMTADHHYEIADATDHTWRPPIGAVACESYLGTPFANEPAKDALKNTIQTCNIIIKKFLQNIHGQLAAGTRLCVAVPCWRVRDKTSHLPLLDDIDALGYSRISFENAVDRQLVYRREDQIVGRELLVLTVS